MCRWNTTWPPCLLQLTMMRKPFSAMPSRFAMSRATMNMWPSAASSASVTSLTVGMGLLGMMSTCTGACGLMSRNAVTRSSLCTMVAGISPAMIFSKIVAMGARIARPDAFRHNCRPLKLTFDTLRSHLSGEPARAYLVSGDEALLVAEAADAIRARVKRAGFDEREVHFIERVADWDAVRAASNNLSLFGARKLIELRLPSGKPGAGGSNAIVELLDGASPDNVYLMITGKLEREQHSSAWVKAFEGAGAWLNIWPVEVARLPQWLRARAAALELELDDAAVQFIVERTEGNLLAAQQELEKLKLLSAGGAPGKRIDLAAAQAAIGDSARFDVFQLGEAATGG